MTKQQYILVPDGYFPNGDSRPWRKALVLEAKGKFISFCYLDNSEQGTAPLYSIKPILGE